MIAQLKNVSKEYQVGDQTIIALEKTTFTLREGELLLIIGPSGSGKTTLLSLIGCVIYPSSGTLWVDGKEVNSLTQDQKASLRLHTIGFVFQNFNLLAPLNAEENVMMPLLLQHVARDEAKHRTRNALERVNMLDRRKSLPKQLSGGQQQRVAVARALINKPDIIFADEPTGNLDTANAKDLHELFFDLRKQFNQTFLIVTHNEELARLSDRVLHMKDGKIV